MFSKHKFAAFYCNELTCNSGFFLHQNGFILVDVQEQVVFFVEKLVNGDIVLCWSYHNQVILSLALILIHTVLKSVSNIKYTMPEMNKQNV